MTESPEQARERRQTRIDAILDENAAWTCDVELEAACARAMEAEATHQQNLYAELVEAAESKVLQHKRRWVGRDFVCDCEICRALANLEAKP